MKRKLLIASVAIATVLASCSKTELVNVDNQIQSLGDRPMVEAPVFTVGGVGTKMTTSGSYQGVKWEAGDGFGAAVMDTYNPSGTNFNNTFTIVDYINSNVLFATEDGKNFYAEASMPEGNHLFYAPFNKENISRAPLATQLPLEQVVANPSSDAAAPSNDIITAFYEDGKYPVAVAYEKIYGDPVTEYTNLQMRHIYSYPLVTLKLGDNLQLYKDGKANVVVDENGKVVKDENGLTIPVYESKIIVDSIVFKPMATKGSIKNSAIKAKLAKVLNEDGTESEKVVWDAAKHENAKTSDIVKFETNTNNFKNVVVKFDSGQELTANKNGYFFMVLPGADYTKAALAVTVHATIDGEHYMSQAAINPAKDVRLLPALPYSADEYDANGDMKASKGTSMTYTINGAFEPYSAAVISGYNAISNYDELATFITDVAYRGEKLVEISKAQAEQMLEDKTYDAQKYFVITADEDAPIALDDDLVVAFNNACVIEGKSASIQFLGNTSKLVLGDITWNAEVNRLFKFGNGSGNVYAKGTVVLKANPGAINVLAGANVTLESDEAITVRNNNGATVNINSEAAHNVSSTYGTVNVMVSTEATVNNGVRIDTDRNSKQTCPGVSKLNIADGVTMTGTVTNTWAQTVNTTGTKTYYAEVNVGNAIVTITNNSKVVVNSNKAKLTVSGNGTVDNTAGAVVRNQGNNTVFATVSTFKDLDVIYDELSGLNKLVVVGSVQNDLPSDKWNLKSAIKTIDFNSGSSLAIGNATWDWTGKDININANVTWMGRDASVSVIKVTLGSINVTGKNKFNVVDIDLYGYQRVVDNNDELAEAIAAGESKVILNEGDYLLDLYNDNVARKSLTITGTKNSKVRFGNKQVRLELFENVTIENCEFDEIMTGKTWGELVFSTGKANGVYTVRNCTFKGIGTQGIYINEINSSAVYNIENCTFNGDFGSEGAITIQNNTDVKHTINVKGCTFNGTPENHKIFIIGNYEGFNLNTDNPSDVYWGHTNPEI